MKHMSSDFPQRRSIRLKEYDYSETGAYFITIVTQERLCLFGNITNGVMNPNDPGKMIAQLWESLPQRFANVSLDSFIVMPNHLHGIVMLDGVRATTTDVRAPTSDVRATTSDVRATTRDVRATTRVAPTGNEFELTVRDDIVGAPLVGARTSFTHPWKTLGEIIGAFKSLTTVEYIRGVQSQGWPSFSGKIWQRNYYEHIIRDEESFNRIRDYIANNPAEWLNDRNNPDY